MITLHKVSRTYRLDDGSSITPVRGINLTVNRGDFVLLIGRSGSGKTSLLNLVAGLMKPTTGEVIIKGTDIWSLTDRELSNLRSSTIGLVFQFPSLIPALNVLENTVLPSSFRPGQDRREARERARVLLHKVGLGERMGVFPRQLSAGEQKRVVLARSLMNKPEILLADEPTSDLDERTEQDIVAVLRELHSSGTTILMVTHSTERIACANRIMKVEEGNLVDFSPAHQA